MDFREHRFAVFETSGALRRLRLASSVDQSCSTSELLEEHTVDYGSLWRKINVYSISHGSKW